MTTCEECRDLLWDYVFDLLEADDVAAVRQHLGGCADCRVELTRAESDRQRLARAGRLDVEVPLFRAPADPDPVTIPFPAVPARRARHVRKWSRLAVAAAVLLAVGLSYGVYARARSGYESAFRQADEQLALAQARRQTFVEQSVADERALNESTRATLLRVNLVGPASYQAAAPNEYQLTLTDLDGKPTTGRVSVRLVDPDKREILKLPDVACAGSTTLSLPRELPVRDLKAAQLEVAVRGRGDAVSVRDYLPVLGPALVTHLATDRPAYRPEEKVYFRSLTLERFGHRPAAQPLALTYALRNRAGVTVVQMRGRAEKNGIGGGEFELPKNLAEGVYTLTVSDAEHRFTTAARSIRVAKEFVKLRGFDPKPEPTDPDSRALEVEFLPEGGDLVAGVESRVYFRVHTRAGQPEDLEGHVLDGTGQPVARLNTERRAPIARGLGVFTFTPAAGERYTLKITSPRGVPVHAQLPAVQKDGLVLRVPDAVAVGADVNVRIEQGVRERRLVLSLVCAGRLVAQQAVTAGPGRTEARLSPPADCEGVLRLTAFDVTDGAPRPVAERLLYRAPAGRLNVTVEAAKPLATGQRATLTFRTTNEAGKPEPAWLLASVVSQELLDKVKDPAGANLPAYFYVLSELDQAQDLEQADILVGDDANSRRALDLFLGTQGWRRFVPDAQRPVLVRDNAKKLEAGSILTLDNRDDVQRKYAAALAVFQAKARTQDAELAREESRLRDDRLAALAALGDFQRRVQNAVRLAAGGLFVVFLALGCVSMTVPLVQVLRGRLVRRRYFVGSAATLGIAALAFLTPLEGMSPKLPSPTTPASPSLALATPPTTAAGVPAARVVGIGPAATVLAAVEPQFTDARHAARVMSGNQGAQPPVPAAVVTLGPQREFAYLRSANPAATETLLWHPVLFTGSGPAQVSFDVPRAGRYHVRVEANSPTGRLGGVGRTLDVK